jgi:formiminoglutamase
LLFSIGGSNDQSYPNVKALLEAYPLSKIGVINLDAHFDVRPLK